MAKVSVTTTTVQQVKLLPSVKRQLLIELQTALKAKTARDVADKAYDASKARIRAIREATGQESLDVDGYGVTNVTGYTTSWDEKKMLAHGLSVAEIESFKTVKPKKAYEKITFPNVVTPIVPNLRDAVIRAQMDDGEYHGE